MDTWIHIKGILKDGTEHDVSPNFVSMKFVHRGASGTTPEDALDHALREICVLQGMTVIKDERQPVRDRRNWYFLPMHMIARLEFEMKSITGNYPDNPAGALKN